MFMNGFFMFLQVRRGKQTRRVGGMRGRRMEGMRRDTQVGRQHV